MQANCTVKAADIKAVLTELAETMRIQLQESKRVVLDGIGSFKLGMSCIGADKAENFNVANNVKEVYVNYTPESTKERIGIDPATGKAKSTFVKDFTRGVIVQEAPKNDVGTSTDDTTTNP
jgi:predicted histone-like DNA-binding protein